MYAGNKVWEDRYETLKSLSSGGQGTTFLVKSKTDSKEAVLKVVNNPSAKKAAARMAIEVAHLRAVADLNGKVPNVYYSNIEDVSSNMPSFFVMEKILGPTLRVFIQDNKLDVSKAIELCMALLDTIKKAHELNIYHRDIKPDNIIVRKGDHKDPVLIDFGLSFNETGNHDLTDASETIENKFLSLPEGRVGDKHNPCSDLTSIVGIFYFIISGQNPKVLLDANNKAPHRRPDGLLEIILKDDDKKYTAKLNAFFDRGFQNTIDSRFSSVDELISRLSELKDYSDDICDVKDNISSLMSLLKTDRKVKLQEYEKNIQRIREIIFDEMRQQLPNSRGELTYSLGPHVHHLKVAVNNLDLVGQPFSIYLSIPARNDFCDIYFIVAAGENEINFLYNISIQPNSRQHPPPLMEWVTITRFNENVDCDDKELRIGLKKALNDAIDELKKIVSS